MYRIRDLVEYESPLPKWGQFYSITHNKPLFVRASIASAALRDSTVQFVFGQAFQAPRPDGPWLSSPINAINLPVDLHALCNGVEGMFRLPVDDSTTDYYIVPSFAPPHWVDLSTLGSS
jgi:hypothetical protein